MAPSDDARDSQGVDVERLLVRARFVRDLCGSEERIENDLASDAFALADEVLRLRKENKMLVQVTDPRVLRSIEADSKEPDHAE